jgi:hypothetical protein
MAGNSLDGNRDGAAAGPQTESNRPPFSLNAPDQANQGDDLVWNFNTTNQIDISAPSIISFIPAVNAINVDLSARPRINFSKLLMGSSVIKSNVLLYSNPVAAEVNYWLSLDNGYETGEASIEVRHDDFSENSRYIPECNSGIKDIYQNCFRPGGSQGGGVGPGAGAGTCTPAPYCCNGIVSANPCSGL